MITAVAGPIYTRAGTGAAGYALHLGGRGPCAAR
jgi:hypothetical protein